MRVADPVGVHRVDREDAVKAQRSDRTSESLLLTVAVHEQLLHLTT